MTNKDKLAKLYEYYHSKMLHGQFSRTTVAIEIAGDEQLVDKIEPLHLPEMIKLICSNDKLLNKYAEAYEPVHTYYINDSISDIKLKLKNKACDSIYFIEKIFPLSDYKILKNFIEAYEDFLDNALKKQAEVSKGNTTKNKLEQEIEEINKEINALNEDNEEFESKKKSLNNKLNKKKKEKEAIENEIEKAEKEGKLSAEIEMRIDKAYVVAKQLIESYFEKVSIARKKAYFLCDEKNAVKSIVENYIKSGEITPQFKEELKKQDFLKSMLETLDSSFCDESVHILAELYDEGLIDLHDDIFIRYLVSHPEQMSAYYVSKFIKDNNLNDSREDYESWTELILDCVLSDVTGDFIRDCYIIWKALAEENKWNDFLDILIEKDEERFSENISKFILMTNGYARKNLLNIVQRFIDEEYIESASALIRELINNHKDRDDCSAIVEYILEQQENELRKTKRNVDRLQFKINKMPGELYGAISDAVESIETLASNIDIDSNKISAKLIASNLKKDILKLREGLETVGVYTLADGDDWLKQKHIAFDSQKHSISISTPPQEVYLRTLGFTYSDVEGEKKVIQAKVGRLQELANNNDNNSSAKKYRRKKNK